MAEGSRFCTKVTWHISVRATNPLTTCSLFSLFDRAAPAETTHIPTFPTWTWYPNSASEEAHSWDKDPKCHSLHGPENVCTRNAGEVGGGHPWSCCHTVGTCVYALVAYTLPSGSVDSQIWPHTLESPAVLGFFVSDMDSFPKFHIKHSECCLAAELSWIKCPSYCIALEHDQKQDASPLNRYVP